MFNINEMKQFVQPFIDSNNYWIPIIFWIGSILITVGLILMAINFDSYKTYTMIFEMIGIITGVGGLLTLIFCVAMLVENKDMKKFPEKYYNKIKREIVHEHI